MDVLVNAGDTIAESPLWSAHQESLWWVDIDGRRLHRFKWSSGQLETWPTEERPGCIVLSGMGGVIAAAESGIFHLDPAADGGLRTTRISTVLHSRPEMRFNDGRCDRSGRMFTGSMVRDMTLALPAGIIYRFDGSGLLTPLVHGLITPNGMAFSPDNRIMYLSDSHPNVQRVWSFSLRDDGRIDSRKEFIDMNHYAGRPDGAAVDSDGCYWICGNDGGCVHRFTPAGRLDRTIAVPVRKPAMCAFVGPRLDWLAITSIRSANPKAPNAGLEGALFITAPGVTGLSETPFRWT